MKTQMAAVLLCATLAGACTPKVEAPSAPQVVAADPIAAGRYLVLVGGCNDCHTPGYKQNGGTTPEADQMTGVPVGHLGPWGTSYASNLRLVAQNMTEDGWVTRMRDKTLLPPMPVQNTSRMSEADLRALYQYIRSLGPKGQPEPENLPPGVTPTTPYENMVPVAPPAPAG